MGKGKTMKIKIIAVIMIKRMKCQKKTKMNQAVRNNNLNLVI